jgi:hypothetical protein
MQRVAAHVRSSGTSVRDTSAAFMIRETWDRAPDQVPLRCESVTKTIVLDVGLVANAMHALVCILLILWLFSRDSQLDDGALPTSLSVAIVGCTLSADMLVVASRQPEYAPRRILAAGISYNLTHRIVFPRYRALETREWVRSILACDLYVIGTRSWASTRLDLLLGFIWIKP